MQAVKILGEKEIEQKIVRIACQILEENTEKNALYFFGIHKSGYEFANRILKCIHKRSPVEVHLNGITINKKYPTEETVKFDKELADIDGKAIILIDDVANSGQTLTYALKPFLNHNPEKIQIAVLVDRKHKRFPVSPDFVGMELSTTLQEHVHVELDAQDNGAFLR